MKARLNGVFLVVVVALVYGNVEVVAPSVRSGKEIPDERQNLISTGSHRGRREADSVRIAGLDLDPSCRSRRDLQFLAAPAVERSEAGGTDLQMLNLPSSVPVCAQNIG